MLVRAVFTLIRVGLLACPLLVSGQIGGRLAAQPSTPAPTATLIASTISIWHSASTILIWSSANAISCSGTGKGFAPSGTSGSLVVSPGVTTTYGVTCTGAGGSASQSVTVSVTAAPTLAIGMTVATTGAIYPSSTPATGTPAIGVEAQGNQGTVIGGPVSADSITWWEVAFNDDLTAWTHQSALAAASPTTPILSFGTSPERIASGASSTLSWSSTNATGCSGTGFSPTGVSGSVSVSPTVSTTYSIACTGTGGSTTRSAAVVVSPSPTFSWTQSLPVTFDNPAIVAFGGTETRALVFMDGSLYAGIGDWEDPELEKAQTPGAQVLRLDSPHGRWVEDKDFNEVVPSTGKKDYQAIAALGTAHFDHDSGNNPITPVDVLMAGFWDLGTNGMPVWEKTVITGSVGAQGTWTMTWLEPPPSPPGQVRSFASYTDSVTNVEMAFAGSKPYGIFSGAFDSSTNSIAWGATAEAGSLNTTTGGDRVMSFAACGGKLYATMYNAVLVRTDGANPRWQKFYQYAGPPLPSESSGFRGLTCVPELNGAGSMLIASLEGDSPNIYDFPLDGSEPTIELYTSNYLASQLGMWVDYGIAAYNNMIVYPEPGTTSCPTLLIGLGVITTESYAGAYENDYPTALYLTRHCNGSYGLRSIVDPSITPAPPLISIRAMAVSQFSGDPAGTLYVGGYDAHSELAHNTDWIYRGVP
jgi:hypothetical protein